MKFNRWDIVKSKVWDNKAEAVVDLQLWQSVYITPRGKMSLSYPERYIINESNLIVKRDNRYKLTYEKIENDYYQMHWDVIRIAQPMDINWFQEWDILSLDEWIVSWWWLTWSTRQFKFVEYINGKAVFKHNGNLYEINQDDLNQSKKQLEIIVNNLYWLSLDDVDIIDEVKEVKLDTKPVEVPLDFNTQEDE